MWMLGLKDRRGWGKGWAWGKGWVSPFVLPFVLPKVKCPVLIIHGLKDTALHASGLNNTWEWVDQDLTIVTLPNAAHFVQQDAADQVTKRITGWLGN